MEKLHKSILCTSGREKQSALQSLEVIPQVQTWVNSFNTQESSTVCSKPGKSGNVKQSTRPIQYRNTQEGAPKLKAALKSTSVDYFFLADQADKLQNESVFTDVDKPTHPSLVVDQPFKLVRE